MTNLEIAKEISRLNELKKERLVPIFELNAEMQELQKQIEELKKQCTHREDNGNFAYDNKKYCKFCRTKLN